jgi:hypothetical protein
VKPQAPPALLAEMFEIQEALEEARGDGLDEAARATLARQRRALAARQAEAEARVSGPLSEAWDAAPPAQRPQALAALKEALATRAYLRTVIDDLDAVLGTVNDDGRPGSAGAARETGGRGGHVGVPHAE